jgi:uncharacterized membrane protein YqgA involved in biofilm formation
MIGTLINAIAILICGGIALASRRQPSPKLQQAIKGLLGVATIFVGLRLTVTSMGGGWQHIGKQLLMIVLSLSIGRMIGQLLRLQKCSNRLGQFAKRKIEEASSGQRPRFADGFNTAALLFCLAPLAFLGSILDGLADKWQTLAIKAVMDGLTTLAFVSTFGWSAIVAVIPVVAFQGTLSLGAKYLSTQMLDAGLINSITAVGGLLVFCVGLVILEIKKIQLTDYLPSLIVAPALARIWPPW